MKRLAIFLDGTWNTGVNPGGLVGPRMARHPAILVPGNVDIPTSLVPEL
jgi:hypothetical protein